MKWWKLLLSSVTVFVASICAITFYDNTVFAADDGPIKIVNEDYIARECSKSDVLNELAAEKFKYLYDCSGITLSEIEDVDSSWASSAWCRAVSAGTTSGSGNSVWDESGTYCWKNKDDAINLTDPDDIVVEGEQNPDYQPNATDGSNSLTTFEECERKDIFGWIICSSADAVSGLIDGIIYYLLIPMLQWRILV